MWSRFKFFHVGIFKISYYVQNHIQNYAHDLIWNFIWKQLTAFAVNYFHKRLHLISLTGIWTRPWCWKSMSWKGCPENFPKIPRKKSPMEWIFFKAAMLKVLLKEFLGSYFCSLRNNRLADSLKQFLAMNMNIFPSFDWEVAKWKTFSW